MFVYLLSLVLVHIRTRKKMSFENNAFKLGFLDKRMWNSLHVWILLGVTHKFHTQKVFAWGAESSGSNHHDLSLD